MSIANGQEFVISQYLEILKPSDKKGKYICPICEGNDLSIAKDGLKYQCFDGCQPKQIAYELRKRNGEFNKRIDKDLLQDYKPSKKTNATIAENNSSSNKLTNAMDVLAFLREKYEPSQIAYNVRTQEIELDSHPLSFDCIRAMIADKFSVDVSSDILRECFLHLAKQNQYDPVKVWLKRCEQELPIPLDRLADIIFGTDDPLHDAYLRCWLIGCVARVLEPGCKFDEALILQGSQGCGKSSFFRVMANGGEFFSDSMTGKLDKDDLMILSRNWINEWGELDGFTAKVYHGNIKHFLSKQEDTYRPPYGRDHQRVLRRSVIVGTTNRTDFLTDPTGDRRFWVIPVKRSIDLESLEKMVMGIWSAAILAYKMGESWRLPASLWQAQAENNREYYTADPWLAILEDKLRMESEMGVGVSTLELLKHLENGGFPHKYSKVDEMRVADILRREGWDKKTVRRGTKTLKVWFDQKNTSESF